MSEVESENKHNPASSSSVSSLVAANNGSSIPRLLHTDQDALPTDGSQPVVTIVSTGATSTSGNAGETTSAGAGAGGRASASAVGTVQISGGGSGESLDNTSSTPPQPPTSQHRPAPRLIFANPPPEDPPHLNHTHSPFSNSHQHPPDLRLQTDVVMTSSSSSSNNSIPVPPSGPGTTRASAAALSRSNSFQSSLSPNSAAGSPSIGGFLSEITPLPSPVITADSPGPWRLFRNGSLSSRPTSRGSIASLTIHDGTDPHLYHTSAEPGIARSTSVGRSPSKRKLYQGLNHIDAPYQPTSNARSVSEQVTNYKLDVPTISRTSQTEGAIHENPETTSTNDNKVVSGAPSGTSTTAANAVPAQPFKREEHLAGRHGHQSQQRARSTADLQVPSVTDGASEYNSIPEDSSVATEIFAATTYPGNNIRRWRAVRLLGQGTFSKVMLATLELKKDTDSEAELDREKLVAVKIVENSAAGGASKARIESSLKRELDILKSLKHPSLVHLKAQSIERKRALLILGYCAGGDLFDLASGHPNLLTPRFVRRIFAELVGAVRYLHTSGIVHRDIKLENVLINFTAEELTKSGDEILNSNQSITTLTDLGLSRRIDFKEPLLTTRCGSEDYAAPELLLGQPYDGRQTDAWALGVLLYAICESRLPFDPVPGANEHKMRSRTAHRIARCDWKWFKLADTPPPVAEEGGAGDQEGEIKESYDSAWNPAKEVVDGLLRRVKKRVPLEEVEKTEWVTGAITVPLEEPPSTEQLEEDSE
ncbi:hypothetical protein H072_7902 [Dactylellina haptotyla CBS 200.50]|uniref:Protein kinase domain-containing protein n=1 Tax=Dactylellina haptotyla (strain CBS 200.50) TaxID=1284197 RepID=S8A5V7_DACHA|nr:hypothetical protein H072_7902 [Dactylellina haptotyla CBS 200.50]